MRTIVWACVLSLVAGCGSGTPTRDGSGVGGAGGVDGGSGDIGGGSGGRGGAAGAGGAGGAADCGGRTCTASEVCVHPSCGGAPPQCESLPDGGQCPAGWTPVSTCTFSSSPGPYCQAPPCTPPASYCLTVPASCGGTPSCACLPRDVCQGGGACSGISRGEVLCVSG